MCFFGVISSDDCFYKALTYTIYYPISILWMNQCIRSGKVHLNKNKRNESWSDQEEIQKGTLACAAVCVSVCNSVNDCGINWSQWLMKRIHRLKLHAVVGAFTLQCFSLLIKYRLTFIILRIARPPAMNLYALKGRFRQCS